jgi:DNA polymerase I-like protein with 3'-5' exonuclease and polymerase domains
VTPPDSWHSQAVTLDAETRVDGALRMVGLGVPNELPVICPWNEDLAAWIHSHEAGWVAYSAAADRHFLRRAGIDLRGQIDDPMLMLALIDEHSWDNRKDRDDTKHPVRGLKAAAQHFLGRANWETDRIRDAKLAGGLRPEWDEILDNEMAAYCAADVAATVALCAHAGSEFAAHPELR